MRSDRRSRGFTLFEVLVVLSLSAIVMLMVGSAIQLHIRMTASRGDAVKNAQLARVILRRVSNDLRAATFAAPVPVDMASDDAADGGTTNNGSSDGGTDDGGTDDGGTGDGGTGDGGTGDGGTGDGGAADNGTNSGTSSGSSSTSMSTGSSDDETGSQQVDSANQTAPGLYGDAEQIRIDMIRAVDTRDWFSANAAGTPIIDTDIAPKPLGSLQTVAYFLNGTTNLMGGGDMVTPMTDPYSTPDSMLNMNAVGGLVRQVVDHPIASWALGNGGGTDLDCYSQLFAPEVISLTFRYFDGTQWGESWDSYEQGGLPVAVEITLVLTTTVGNMSTSSLYQGFQDPDSVYTMVVHIPAALPTDETEAQL